MWTSTGSYGAQSWNGSGTAIISDTSSTTYQVTIADSLSLGNNTGFFNYTIPGTVLPDGTIMYGDPANEEVGTGTGTINAMAATVRCYSYKDQNKTIKSDYISAETEKGCAAAAKDFGNPWIKVVNNNTVSLSGTIDTVPEPSSLALLLFGLLSFIPILRFRCTRKTDFKRACPSSIFDQQ
jgi:hypothetical protein